MIAYSMLYASAVGLLLLLAALLGSSVLRKQGNADRGVWLAALALALALPFLALAGPGDSPVTAASPVVETGLIGLPAVVAVPAVPTVTVSAARSARLGLDELLIGLWFLASLMLAVRWAVAVRRLGAVIRSCPSTTVDGVRVSLTSNLGPAVAGVLEPRIVAPQWLLSMPDEQRSLVLAHEQEHIRAGDPWLAVVARVARILAPWNPFVWLLSSRLLRAVELDCDRRVLRRHPDIEAYGLTLLTVSSRDPSGLLGAAAFTETEAPLRRRILAMTTPPKTVPVVGILASIVLGTLLIVGAFEIPIPTFRLEVAPEPSEMGTVPDPLPSGTVTAMVTEAVSERPLTNVQIWMPGTGLGGLSNPDGRFLLMDVPAGEHQVVAELIGYGQVAGAVTVGDGETTTLHFRLEQTAIPIERVIVGGPSADGSASAGSGMASSDPPIDGEKARAETASGSGIPGRPTFTPFSVAPRVINAEEVRRAMMQAYPSELRDEGIGGTVEVYFFIDEDGHVQANRINSSSGHPTLDEAALAVAGLYRFSPARNRDARRPVWVTFPITFVPTV
jgi:TonB family protein